MKLILNLAARANTVTAWGKFKTAVPAIDQLKGDATIKAAPDEASLLIRENLRQKDSGQVIFDKKHASVAGDDTVGIPIDPAARDEAHSIKIMREHLDDCLIVEFVINKRLIRLLRGNSQRTDKQTKNKKNTSHLYQVISNKNFQSMIIPKILGINFQVSLRPKFKAYCGEKPLMGHKVMQESLFRKGNQRTDELEKARARRSFTSLMGSSSPKMCALGVISGIFSSTETSEEIISSCCCG